MTGPFGTTAGVWRWVENALSNGKPDTWSNSGMAALVSGDNVVCWFGNDETYYPTEGEGPSPADKRAIAQVPAMLALVDAVADWVNIEDVRDMARAIVRELEGE